jgi:diacylglycerol kinase (ATP)
MKSLIKSFKYALEGIIYCWQTQRNIKIHFILGAAVIWGSFFFDLSKTEILIILLTIVSVLITEMINTAIEKTVDLFTKDYHPLAKIAKNVAAGSVLVAAVNSLIVAYLIFAERLYLLFVRGLSNLKEIVIFLLFVAFICFLLVLVVRSSDVKR